ncbi:MAG: DNA-binding protein WhiA [Eubacteriales bacterium]
MSFSSNSKDELASNQMMSQCCLQAQAYGLVLFGRSFSHHSISFTSEHTSSALLYAENLQALINISPQIETGIRKKTSIKIRTASERLQVLEYFGHSPNELTPRINRANLSDDCCFGAFIRGAFFSCGTVTSPEKNYHLEFVVPHLKLSLDLIKLLDEVQLNSKHIIRNGSHIVYFKDSESIEDILTLMGATNASLELMGIKMQKNMINRINRKVNFEVANLSRTVEASIQQVKAINLIDSQIGLGHIPITLREVAILRRENPEISLKDLGDLLKQPISRSGINHRLNRIVEIAKELEK